MEGSPISTVELWSSVRVTIGFLVTSLTKALLPRLLHLAGRPALGRVLVVPIFFHLRTMEATVFLGTFNAAGMFWYPSPDLCLNKILTLSSKDNSFDLMCCFFLWYELFSDVTLYRQVCAFLHFNQLTLPQVDSNQVVETSQEWSMETGCTWAQFWAS